MRSSRAGDSHRRRHAELVQGDLARSGVPKRVVDEGARLLGGLDVLINNAGSLVSRRPFLEVDDAWIDAVFNLNARAVIGRLSGGRSDMERRGGGAIINVGSIAGLDGGGSGAGIYGSAKAFVHNLTRHLARELAPRNIRVNTVSPGVVETPFHAGTPPERMEAMRKSVSARPDRHAGRLRRRVSVPGLAGAQRLHHRPKYSRQRRPGDAMKRPVRAMRCCWRRAVSGSSAWRDAHRSGSGLAVSCRPG